MLIGGLGTAEIIVIFDRPFARFRTADCSSNCFGSLFQQTQEVKRRNEEVCFLCLFDPGRSHGLSVLRQRIRAMNWTGQSILLLPKSGKATGYKHFAPPEQRKTTFRAKPIQGSQKARR